MAFLHFVNSEFRLNYKKIILITISIILFAVIDELHQKFIPGRSFNVKDIISDIAGILAAVVFCVLVFRKITERIEKLKQ